MTHEEKRAWIRLAAAVIAYGAYSVIILRRAEGGPLAETPYAATLLWSIGLSIAASVAAEVVLGMVNPKASRAKDVRDQEIGRLGDYFGQAFVVIGGVAAMLMAMAEWAPFWIANVVYLCFVLSAVVGNVGKIFLYHGSMPRW